jgi:hypothetical protein
MEERRRLVFAFYQHLTTLSTAIAVIASKFYETIGAPLDPNPKKLLPE